MRIVWQLILGLTALVVLVFVIPPDAVNRYDEGLIVQGASQVLHGRIPYRDFWSLYAPGQFWALAGWFKLFGTSLLSERLWDAVARTLLVMACYGATVTISGRRGAGVAALVFSVVWLRFAGFYGYPLIPAAAAAVAACTLLIRWQQRGNGAGYLIGAGVLATLAALFRHDVGAYTALLLFAGVWVGAGNKRSSSLLTVLAAIVLSGLPALMYLLVTVGIQPLWQQLIVFPLTRYADMRALPFPSVLASWQTVLGHPGHLAPLNRALIDLMVVLPLPVGILGVFLALGGNRRNARIQRVTAAGGAFATGLMATLTLLLFLKGVVRPSVVQMLPAILLAGVLIASWGAAYRLTQGPAAVAMVTLLLPPVSSALIAWHRDGPGSHTIVGVAERWRNQTDTALPRARGFKLPHDQLQAIRYTRRHTRPGEAIYVGKPRHDQLFVNDMLFYFLANRPPATHYAELHPGVVTTRATQQAMIAALERQAVRWVVIWRGAMRKEPNASGHSSGVHRLDRYLEKHFRKVRRFGEYTIVRRNVMDAQ